MTNTRHLKNEAASVAEQASVLAEDVRELGHAAKRTVAHGADAIRETANDYLEQGKTKAREAGEMMQEKVGEKPITSLLVAGAVGFLIGMLWVRR
jgi:ElaB/YqjD/DUF883 family membrane-anchored ribosome-binding protein